MDAKFTILTLLKELLSIKMVRKLFSIKIKYSILPLSQMKNLSDLMLTFIFFLFPHKLSDPGTIWMNTTIKKKTLQII
jgi:hypothetical protein